MGGTGKAVILGQLLRRAQGKGVPRFHVAFLSHRFQIYSNQSALESLAVSWGWHWVGPGFARGPLTQTCMRMRCVPFPSADPTAGPTEDTAANRSDAFVEW